jgi:hypothetical protein
MVWTDGVCMIDFDIKNPKLYFLFFGGVLIKVLSGVNPKNSPKALF